MRKQVTPDEILDCRYLDCPVPIIKMKKTMIGMKAGEIIEIQSTGDGTKNDIPAFVLRHGHEYLGHRDEAGFTRSFAKIR